MADIIHTRLELCNMIRMEAEHTEDTGFPLEVFPQTVQSVILDMARYENYKTEFIATAMISAVSAALGGTYRIRIKGEWQSNAALYIILVGRPGLGKTPPLEAAYRPIRKHDYTLFKAYESELESWKAAGENGKKPVLRRTVVSDFTPESLLLTHSNNPRSVVILVDEYDKPMLQSIGNEELQNEYRNTLKAFYSVMKTQDRYIRFGFLTGVTKFGKVSVFSDLNNLIDLSMDRQFQTLCGMTDKEIHTYFEEPLHQIAENYGITYDEVCLRLKERYDGYRFRQNGTNLYNPFSLLNTFRSLEFGSYWFETGTPTYLVKLLKDNNFCLPDLTSEGVTAETLTDVESFKDNPIAVIYQSGYLTIKEYDEEFNIYRLGFPNKEVAEGFIKYLVPYYMPIKDSESVY